jgi:hypothetical protein
VIDGDDARLEHIADKNPELLNSAKSVYKTLWPFGGALVHEYLRRLSSFRRSDYLT